MEKMTAVDRTTEKIQLAKELGLHDWAKMREIIDMKFKPITYGEVCRKLNEGKLTFNLRNLELYRLGGDDWFMFSLFVAACGLVLTLVTEIILHGGALNVVSVQEFCTEEGAFVALAFVIAGLFRCAKRIEVESMPFTLWKDDLPYGALLAVKEAKEKGFDHFQIYYPVSERIRVKSDPVIVGWSRSDYDKSDLRGSGTFRMGHEIFFWDDGKIYE